MIKCCVECKKKFECYDKHRTHGKWRVYKRPTNSITCSHKCSVLSYRNRHRLINKQKEKTLIQDKVNSGQIDFN